MDDETRILTTLNDEELFHWRELFGDWPHFARRRVEQLEAEWWRRVDERMELASERVHRADAEAQQARIDELVGSLGMMKVAISAAGKTWAYVAASGRGTARSTGSRPQGEAGRCLPADRRASKTPAAAAVDRALYPGRGRRVQAA